MTVWRTPVYPYKGKCRVKLHGSKIWQAGYSLIDWQTEKIPVVKNLSTGSSLAVDADRVEV